MIEVLQLLGSKIITKKEARLLLNVDRVIQSKKEGK
jgi:hypothetical protein